MGNLVTLKNYQDKVCTNQGILAEKRAHLLNYFSLLGIKTIHFTSVGNSIASGFTLDPHETPSPLFMKDKDLGKNYDGSIFQHSFARPKSNCDDLILEWYLKNLSEQEMARIWTQDTWAMRETEENKTPFFETPSYIPPTNFTFQEQVKLQGKDVTNIFLYHGATGSLIDLIDRYKVMPYHFVQILRKIDRDINCMQAALKVFQMSNATAQFYVSGYPNMLGIDLVELIDKKTRQSCEEFSNVTFMKGANRNLLYKNQDGKYIFDPHHLYPEYLELLANFYHTVSENYLENQFTTELLMQMKNLTDMIEKEYYFQRHSVEISTMYENLIHRFIEKYQTTSFEQVGRSIVPALKKAKLIYLKNYPHNYFCSIVNQVAGYFDEQIETFAHQKQKKMEFK